MDIVLATPFVQVLLKSARHVPLTSTMADEQQHRGVRQRLVDRAEVGIGELIRPMGTMVAVGDYMLVAAGAWRALDNGRHCVRILEQVPDASLMLSDCDNHDRHNRRLHLLNVSRAVQRMLVVAPRIVRSD